MFDHNPHIIKLEDIGAGRDVLYAYLDTPACKYHESITDDVAVFKPGHVIDTLCAQHGVAASERRCDLYLTADEKQKAEEITHAWGSFLTVEPHAKTAFTANKIWPLERWQAVVDALAQEQIIVQVGLGDRPVLRGVQDLTGQLTFRETAAVIGRSRLLMAVEGGLMHAANAVGTRAVIVFGGYIDTALTGYPEHICLGADTPCAPCGLRKPCPRDRECMERISVAQVLAAVRRVLSEEEAHAGADRERGDEHE